MAERLEARLAELSAFLAQGHAGSGVEEIIAHLRDDVADAMSGSRASVERCLRLLLVEQERGTTPPSLLAFLDASASVEDDARKREVAQAVQGVLDTLETLVGTGEGRRALSRQHVAALYRCCQATARASPYNKVKAAALSVIVTLLKRCPHLISAGEMEPKVFAEKLFYDLKFGKSTQTAKGAMLEVLGSLAKAFPREMESMAKTLLDWIETALDQQFAAAVPQFQMITGLFVALARFLVYDRDRYENEANMRQKIYKYLHSTFAATVGGNLSRFQVSKASQQFLAENAHAFRAEIAASSHTWFTFMKFCCTSDNKTIRERASQCASNVLRVLNLFLLENKDGDGDCKKALSRMLKDVLPCITNSGVGSADVLFAIQVLKAFVPTIHAYLGQRAAVKIEDKLRGYGEAMMTMDARATAKSWSLFSQFIKCTGAFIREVHTTALDDGYLGFLGDMLCHVMEAYPFCSWDTRWTIYKSFIALFEAVGKSTVVDTLIDRVVQHTLLLSLSNVSGPNSQAALYHPETGNLVTELVYSFVDFWVALLGQREPGASEFEKSAKSETSSMAWSNQRRKLLDSLAKSMLDIIRSLDLSYSFEIRTTVSSSDFGGFKPTVPRDHSIMTNLSELVERTFPHIDIPLLAPWVPLLLNTIVSRASVHPLVSSFYRIGAVLAEIGEKTALFGSSGTNDEAHEMRSELIKGYTHFVHSTSSQLRFYQDELLVASSKLILATPADLLDVDAVSSALKATLSLGISYLPAAEIGVSALEKWQSQHPDQLAKMLIEVVPLLAPFLNQREPESRKDQPRRTGVKAAVSTGDDVSDYAKLQIRVLKFLGSVGGAASSLMSRPPEKLTNQLGGATMSTEELQLSLELSDVTMMVPVGALMLEVGELALNSTERRVKASASETFHALVCYLCGKTATHPHTAGSKSVFYGLWRPVLGCVLRLATDPEKICRALFEPLVFQLLRWLSSNSKTFPFEYSDAVDQLIAGLSDVNSATRAMSSKCIASILTSAVEAESLRPKSSEHVEDIFVRLFSLCRHPGAVQRSGAAMTISYFLQSLNEENVGVVKSYATRCLLSLLSALRFSDRDAQGDASGNFTSQIIITKAIQKIEQEVSRSPELFKTASGAETDQLSLSELTHWLFLHVGSREGTFRTVCRRMFVTFSRLVSGTSCKQWIIDYAGSSPKQAISSFIAPVSTLAPPQISEHDDSVASSWLTLNWLTQLGASVEALTWLATLLEGQADLIFTDDVPGAKAKRKRTDLESPGTELGTVETTMSAAISAFLRFSAGNSGNQSRDYEKREYAAYVEGTSAVSQLVALALESRDPALARVIDVEDSTVQAALTEKLLDLLMRDDVSEEHSAEIKRCIGEITRSSAGWRHQLRRHAEMAADALDRDLQSNKCGADARRIQEVSSLFFELIGIGVLPSDQASPYAKVFARAADALLELKVPLPEYYAPVVTAIKAASACGWQVTDIFVDVRLRRQYGPMYNDIVRLIALLPVWRQCCGAVMSLAQTNTQVLSMLTSVFGLVASGQACKPQTKEREEFALEILPQLTGFARQATAQHPSVRMLLDAMEQVLRICESCPRPFVDEFCENQFPAVCDALVELLASSDLSFLAKVDALRLASRVVCISRSSASEQAVEATLLKALQSFMIAEFPIKSTDVKRGTRDFDVFRLLFVELLGIVERSSSGSFLRLLFPCLREGEQHLFFADMKAALSRYCDSICLRTSEALRTNVGVQQTKVALQMLQDLTELLLDSHEDAFVRRTLFEEVFTPYAELLPPETLQAFFLSKYGTAQKTVLVELTRIASKAMDATSEPNFTGAAAFMMLEILFRLVDPECVRGEMNEVFLGHKNGKGREFTMLVCKCANKVATQQQHGEPSEVKRLVCVGAYSCLHTAVSRTQKQEKIFDQLLFHGNVWNNIIDCSCEIQLKAVTEAFDVVPLTQYSPSTLVNRQRWSHKAVSTRRTTSAGSMVSQSLDFFTASSLSQAGPTSSLTTMLPAIDGAQKAYGGTELELDAISSHPCMPSLLRTLMEMKNQFGSTWQPGAMPSWMKKLHDAMCQPSAPLNVRLLFVKLVLSVPSVFTPYATLWLPAILNAVMETGLSSDAEFHYLLRDVCHLILDTCQDVDAAWDADDCSRFLNTLLALCPHPTSSVRDDNLVLVTRLMLRWKDVVKVDVGILVDFLFSDESENERARSPQKVCGLQLVSALIAAGLTPEVHHTSSTVSGRTLKEGIVLAMKDPRAAVYSLAAEVGGVFLTSAEAASSFDDICEIALDAHNHEDYQRFLAIVRNVSLHEPRIIDSAMLNRLAFVLPKAALVDSWSRHGIEAIENAARNEEVAGEAFGQVRGVLDRYINHRDEGVRFTALRVVAGIFDKLTPPDLELVCEKTAAGGMGLFEAFASHDDPACRRTFYEVVQRIFEKRELTDEFAGRVRGAVLRGFIDPDSEIRDQTLQFCSSSELLPSVCGKRLVELFESFYAPDIVDSWTLYVTNLLMGLSQRSGSFDSALFADALGTSGFVDATIDTTWESKNQSMAPLFSLDVDTALASTDSSSFPGQFTFGTAGTQAAERLGSSTQSQLVLSSIASQGSQGGLPLGPQGTSRQLQQRRGRFLRQSDSGGSSTGPMFGRGDKAASRRFFQDKHKMAKKALEASVHRQRKARSEHVTMRRKYRVGEYPDIQISLRDIVAPMMALCSVHHATSSRVFGMLFASIVDGDDHFKTGDGLDTLSKRIARTLTESKRSGAFVGCIQQAYFSCLTKNRELLERFQLPSKVVAESSLASGSYYSGELVLEELLIRTSNVGDQTLLLDADGALAEQWDQLHKIVGTIQKRNFLLAIASKCSATDESRLALEARLAGNLPTAVASYAKAESILISQMEMAGDDGNSVAARLDSRRCFWERLGCLETLNSWSKLEEELRQRELNDASFVWTEETPYLEQGVGHKLRCSLGVMDAVASFESDTSQRLGEFIKDAAKDPAKWQVLSSKFAVETILAYMKLEDASQARILLDGVYSSFLQRWQGTNALAVAPRLELMQMLSSTVQMDEVLSFIRNVEQTTVSEQGTAAQERQYFTLVEKWTASSPDVGEGSISAWSQYYQVQDVSNDFLWAHGSRSGVLPDSAHSAFLRAKSVVMLGYANAALSNDIMAVTSRYLKEYREICNVAQLPKVSVRMVDVFVSHILKLAERQLQRSTANTLSTESTKLTVRYFQTATKLFDNSDVLELMETITPDEQSVMRSLEARTFGRAANFYMMASLDRATSEEYFVRALDVFQSSCKTTATTGKPIIDEQLARPRLAFVEFLSDLLSNTPGVEWEQFVDKERVVQHLVDCVLDGMIFGSQECATFFPQLCELIAPFPTVTAAFCGKVLASVPLWTCLQWSGQLMALLNGAISSSILPILEKMAGQYPVALFYDFKVTCSGLSSSAFKADTRRLGTLLANPTMEKFVDALRLIHHPEIRLKEGLREVGKLLDDKKANTARAKMDHVLQDCFSLERSTLGSKIGRYNRDWARKAKRDIEKVMGKNAANLTPKTVMAARDWIAKSFSVCPGKHGITRDMKARLGDFAEWLEEFDPTKHRLELPGQYTAHWGKPDPSQHTTILSFDAMMGVLPSKQLPKRLTLRCSDEREYTFLVKGGEDLRLDQRIEQLFGVMNHVLRVDPQCRSRQLSTRTYQVIPMTQDIGLIEWLDGTSTLKSVIETQLRQDERCAHLQSNKRQKLELFNTTAAKTYESFLLKQRGASFSAKVITPSSRDVETTFSQVQAQLPGDLLRRQLFRLGSGFDAFLAIRDRFLASLAVFSACSYILGIGDRHMDNFLLDLSDGRVVGIDFGVSFGAGASLLPVPELIPFRYTRQMDFVLQPYDGHNLMAQEMQLVLEALRSKKQVIESVLNVFLHEPLMDWQQTTTTFQSGIFAGDGESSSSLTSQSSIGDDSVEEERAAKEPRTSRAGRGRASASTSSSSSARSSAPLVSTPMTDADGGDLWLPDVKIAIARRKLEGFAPRVLLKEELAQNVHLKAQLVKFHALVDSVGSSNGPASGEPAAGLTSLAQAQELLKLATAPDILGRTYFGWMPWL